MRKKFRVNGQDVDYLNIRELPDGTVEVIYSERFNIATAHMGDIMKRVRDNGLECMVFKDLSYGIVSIWLQDIDDLHGILYSLEIPEGSYEVLYEDLMVVVDVPKLYPQVESEGVLCDG